MTGIRVNAWAKVNLTLRVLARLPNGYHTLRSLVCPLSLHDQLEIERRSARGIEIKVSFSDALARHIGPDMGRIKAELEGEGNLIAKAYHQVAERLEGGVRVRLHKAVPLGAGLGGGSADAAAFLSGVTRLFSLELEPGGLIDVAGRVGSDVPVLTAGRVTFMYGTGGKLAGVCPAAETNLFNQRIGVVVIKPPFPIPTPWAYGALTKRPTIPAHEFSKEEPRREADTVRELRNFGLKFAESEAIATERLTFSPEDGSSGGPEGRSFFEGFATFVNNDFESLFDSAARDCEAGSGGQSQALDEARRSLIGLGAGRALLAGSGSALVGFVDGFEGVDALALRAKEALPQGWFVEAGALLPLTEGQG